MKTELDLTTTLLRTRLQEYETGERHWNLDDILKIRTALKDERPVAEFIMTTIFNAMSYLHHDYPLTEEADAHTILTFLEAFYAYSQKELLTTAGTYKDGISMTLPEEPTHP